MHSRSSQGATTNNTPLALIREDICLIENLQWCSKVTLVYKILKVCNFCINWANILALFEMPLYDCFSSLEFEITKKEFYFKRENVKSYPKIITI